MPGRGDGPPHLLLMENYKHEDLLLMGNKYASATLSCDDWPTIAVIVFRDLSDDGKVNFALESVNGPWGRDPNYENDFLEVSGFAVSLLKKLGVESPDEYWQGNVWEV